MKIVNIKADKLRYQTNSLSYLLVLLSVLLSILALFTLITYDSFGKGTNPIRVIPDFRIGLEIGLGIILLLMTFLAAEKVKYHDAFWSCFGLFILAGVNFLRIFNIPLYALKKGWIPTNIVTVTIIEFALAVALLVIAGIISTLNVIILKNYMKVIDKNGNSGA